MRKYTERSIQDKGIALARDPMEDLGVLSEEFNGQVDSNQLPLEGVTTAKLKHEANATASRRGPFNRTYESVATDWAEVAAIATWDADSSDWSSADWVQLSDKLANGGDTLSVDCLEGVVEGVFSVDCGKAASENTSTNGTYSQQYWEVAIFANGQLVGRSGLVRAARRTKIVPFHMRVATENVTFDVRWRAFQYDPPAAVVNPALITHQPFEVWGAGIYVNNKNR